MQREELTRQETDDVIRAIDEGVSVIHLCGEPLVLKEDVLEEIADRMDNWNLQSVPVREGWSLDYLIQKLIIQIGRELGTLEKTMERISSLKVSMAGFGGGVELQNQADLLIEQLRTEVERYDANTPLIITVRQLDVLDEDPSLIEAKLNELFDILPEDTNVHFLTVGGFQFSSLDTVIEVTPFHEQHSVRFLRAHYSNLSIADAQEIHERVDGYPLYLKLITQTHDSLQEIDLTHISDDVFDHIEAYERTFSDPERRFLRRVSALTELDERTCALITELDTMEAGDMLRALNGRLVLQELGRRDRLTRYTMRGPFQSYFHEHGSNTTEIHRRLFQHYANQVIDGFKEEDEWLSQSLAPTTLCTIHLVAAYDGDLSAENVQAEIDRLDLEPTERLQFAIGSVSQIASQVDDVDGLQALEIDEVRRQLNDQEETSVEELVTVDYVRAFSRLLDRAHQDNAAKKAELIEEATEIAETGLEDLIEEKYGIQGEVPDNTQIGNLEMAGYLLAAYGHHAQGNKRETRRYLNKPLTVLESIGIPKSTALTVFYRGQGIWKKLALKKELGSVLSSNLGDVVGAAQENDSLKETLLTAQGNLDEAFRRALLEAFQILYKYPYELQLFIEDVGQILFEDQAVVRFDENHVMSCGVMWYQFASSLQLYDPLEFTKYRRIHEILSEANDLD